MGTITLTQNVSDETADTYLYPNNDLSNCTDLLPHGDVPNYLCVNENREIPDDDDTYVYWKTPVVSFDLYELPKKNNLGTINYIQVYTRVKSADNAQHVDGVYKIICSPDSTCTHVYKSDDMGLTTSYKNYFKVWTNNPATDTTWTWTDINLLCIGEECSSPTLFSDTLTSTFRPNAVGAFNQHKHKDGSAGNGTNYTEVDDIIADDDDTYVYWDDTITNPDDNYNIPNHTTEIGTIESVSLFIKAKETTSTGSIYFRFYIGGAHYPDPVDAFSRQTLSDTYTLYSRNYTLNPATSVAWTWNNIDNLQVGFESKPGRMDNEIRITQIYLVVYYAETTNPEIRTTQCYAKVNYNPSDETCTLNCPEEVSTNHSSNIKTMNMWNGERVVYSLNRSGKSMLLTGKEIDYNCASEPETFYFNAYSAGEAWANNPGNMVDGNAGTWAYDTVQGTQALTGNTCSGGVNVITKIEIRAYVKGDNIVGNPPDVILRPIFTAGDGSSFEHYNAVGTAHWTEWYDITTDENSPESWTWTDVQNLKCDIESKCPVIMGAKTQCAKVEMRVTTKTQAAHRMLCVHTMGKIGADVVISDFSFDAFNGTYKIRSFGWDKISEKPVVYSWILDLEDAEL